MFKNISDGHLTKLRALCWCCRKYNTKLFLRFCIFPSFPVWNLHDSLNCTDDAFRYQINRMCFAWGKWIWRKSQITMLWPFAPVLALLYLGSLHLAMQMLCDEESGIPFYLYNRMRELLFLPLRGKSEKIFSLPNPENLEISQIMEQDELDKICLIFCHLLRHLLHNLNFCQFLWFRVWYY